MTLVIERLIFCDGIDCIDSNYNGDDRNYFTAKELRLSRKNGGWIQRGSKDYCPECKVKIKEQKRKLKNENK